MLPHLVKEERCLFPAVRELTKGHIEFPFGSVRNPIGGMIAEYEVTGKILAALRSAASGYLVPADGCDSYRMLYERLAAVEADTHLHVFKENWVLVPAAVHVEEEERVRQTDGDRNVTLNV
jgi:regulator of cell morphogenesis and NO signaling